MKKIIGLFAVVALVFGAAFWSAGAFADGVSPGSVARITGGTIKGLTAPLIVGSSSVLYAQDMIEARKNQNALTSIGVDNAQLGTASGVSIQLFSADAGGAFYAFSSAYTGVAGWADSVVVRAQSDAANGLWLVSQAAGSSIKISPGAAATAIATISGSGVVVVGGMSATTLKTGGYTVATLPTCNAGLAGTRAYVTDATAPAWNTALTGGGAVVVPVFCNGTAWVSS